MKILLIGSNGMLGSMLVRMFDGHDLIALDKEDIDITDKQAIIEKGGEIAPAVVINAAAYTDVDRAEDARELAFAVNADGAENVALASKAVGATLVHYSTDYVFPGEAKDGYAEDDLAGPPVNVYGESKLEGEKRIQSSGVDYYIIRTAWLYGPNGKNFVSTMLSLAEKNDELRVVNDQFGCPTYTKDLAGATRYLLEEKFPFGIYHGVNSGVASWFDLAQETFRVSGSEVRVVGVLASEFPRPAKRPSYSVLKNTKHLPMRPWQAALEDFLST